MYLSLSEPFLKAILGEFKGPAVYLWACGRGRAQLTSRPRYRVDYQLGYSQALPAFLFIPGSHGVPKITGSQCSTFEENLRTSQGQTCNFCVCPLIPELFIKQIGAGPTVGKHFPCPREAYGGAGQ